MKTESIAHISDSHQGIPALHKKTLENTKTGIKNIRKQKRVRGQVLLAATSATIIILLLFSLTLGDYPLSIPQVIQAITTDQGAASNIVLNWRLPRVLAAVIFGASLGISGAIFQTMTKNPLGSPDIIGLSTGSYTGVIIVITLVDGGIAITSLGSLIGGLLTAIVIYILAWKNGMHGYRLIVIGVAVTAMLHSLNVYLLLKAQAEVSMTAAFWGAGSLSTVNWSDLQIVVIPVVIFFVLVALLVRPLRQLELGDELAQSHGTHVESTRLMLLGVGVGLVATVTAITGPIAFIALSAPQIAKLFSAKNVSIPLPQSGMIGALLLMVSDLIAQHVMPQPVPVGVVTVVLGGVYLISLLIVNGSKR